MSVSQSLTDRMQMFPGTYDRRERAQTPPRKVVLATVKHWIPKTVTMEERLRIVERLVDESAARAEALYPGQGLDLVVLPEHILMNPGQTARERSVALEGHVTEVLGIKARQHGTYLVLPIIRTARDGRVYNSAALMDRTGKIVGVYDKIHPVSHPDGTLEAGATPGNDVPVFEADFGKVGFQICWDMSFEDGWAMLAERGAEIVCVPSASPQTVRPSAYAMLGRYYVATSTPRDNATIYNPIGVATARLVDGQGDVLVHQVDLAFAVLHYAPGLRDGTIFTERFGERAGFDYSTREDTGVFWSNDPERPIGQMVRELGLRQLCEHVEQDRRDQAVARKALD